MRRRDGAKGEVPDVAASLQVCDPSAGWKDLPDWLAFFFRLGQEVAYAHETGTKTCAVVIPPVRSFAAAFAATGAVMGVGLTSQSVPDPAAHFGALASLEKGTAVVVTMGQRIYAARFKGVVDRNGERFLKVEYDGMTHYLPEQASSRVRVGVGGKRSLPKSATASRSPGRALIEGILAERASDYLSIPTVDTVLVGQVSLIERELASVKVRQAGSPAAVAPLGGLLRPSRLLPDGGISRSLVLSDRIAEFEMPVDDVPHVAVFDGPRALARYRSRFPASSWVAVLDRCSATFREGVDVANEEFAMRTGEASYIKALEVPAGTEAQAFERRT